MPKEITNCEESKEIIQVDYQVDYFTQFSYLVTDYCYPDKLRKDYRNSLNFWEIAFTSKLDKMSFPPNVLKEKVDNALLPLENLTVYQYKDRPTLPVTYYFDSNPTNMAMALVNDAIKQEEFKFNDKLELTRLFAYYLLLYTKEMKESEITLKEEKGNLENELSRAFEIIDNYKKLELERKEQEERIRQEGLVLESPREVDLNERCTKLQEQVNSFKRALAGSGQVIKGQEIDLKDRELQVNNLQIHLANVKEQLNRLLSVHSETAQTVTKNVHLNNQYCSLLVEKEQLQSKFNSLQRKYKALSFFTNPISNFKSYIFWTFITLLIIVFVLTLNFIIKFFRWITPKKWKKRKWY